MPSWPEVLEQLIAGRDLSTGTSRWAMAEIFAGAATPAQIGAFLTTLHAKGETVDEIAGMADAMIAAAEPLPVTGPCVDIVGTGGDHAKTVNISTTAALVIAGAGYRVVKHGNRAASSASGAADVLEALGVRLDLPADQIGPIADELGITFAFARVFHPAMRFAGPVRKELGVPTVFNVLGPLTNPAHPAAAAVGVAGLDVAPLVAGVFAHRGMSALVFRGRDGLDELTTTGPSDIWEVHAGDVRHEVFDPASLGIPRAELADLRGGDPAHNAGVTRAVLAGEPGPVRDAVLLNAAAGIVAADLALGTSSVAVPLVERLRAARDKAAVAIDSGAAQRILSAWAAATSARHAALA